MVKEEGARTAAETVPAVAGQSRTKNVAWLATLAKQAYEQKRANNCLALTRAILLIDPENAEARAMQAAIQSPGNQPEPERPHEPEPVVAPREEFEPISPESQLLFTASPVPASELSKPR